MSGSVDDPHPHAILTKAIEKKFGPAEKHILTVKDPSMFNGMPIEGSACRLLFPPPIQEMLENPSLLFFDDEFMPTSEERGEPLLDLAPQDEERDGKSDEMDFFFGKRGER